DLGTAQRLSLTYHFGAPAPEPSASAQARPSASPLQSDDLAAGRELEKAGRSREALTVYNNAIRKNRLDAQAWRAAGNLYYRMGKKDYAVQCFDQVLKLSPGDTALKTWLDHYRQ